jgi:hypothetical protein
MLEGMDVRDFAAVGDRLLVILPGAEFHWKQVSSAIADGQLVALVPDEDLQAARRLAIDCENTLVMADVEAAIPWQENYFTKVFCLVSLDASDLQRLMELMRVTGGPGECRVLVEESFEQPALDLLRQMDSEATSERDRQAAVLVAKREPLPPRRRKRDPFRIL